MKRILISEFAPRNCSMKGLLEVHNITGTKVTATTEFTVKQVPENDNEDDVTHATCSTICPLGPVKAKQEKNDVSGSRKEDDSTKGNIDRFMPTRCLKKATCESYINKGAVSDLIVLGDFDVIYKSGVEPNSSKDDEEILYAYVKEVHIHSNHFQSSDSYTVASKCKESYLLNTNDALDVKGVQQVEITQPKDLESSEISFAVYDFTQEDYNPEALNMIKSVDEFNTVLPGQLKKWVIEGREVGGEHETINTFEALNVGTQVSSVSVVSRNMSKMGCQLKGKQCQRQIELSPHDVKIIIDEMSMFYFDPGGDSCRENMFVWVTQNSEKELEIGENSCAYEERGADVINKAAKAMVGTKKCLKKTNEFTKETSAMWKSIGQKNVAILQYTKGDHPGLSNHEFVGVIKENTQLEDKLKIWYNRKAGLGFLGCDLVALAGGALEQVAKRNLTMAIGENDQLPH